MAVTTHILIDNLADIGCKIVYNGGYWIAVSFDGKSQMRIDRRMHPLPTRMYERYGPDGWGADARHHNKVEAERLLLDFLRGEI
jgi:hypothetical protein